MSVLLDYLSYLDEQVRNHSIYVWGAQGQKAPTITEAWIKGRETSTTNANRAIIFWQAQVNAGYGDVLRAFDCSGLGMYWLQNIAKIYTSDMTSNGMKGKCVKLSKSDLKKGDWVFRVDSSGKAYHIGYVVDEKLNVIEAKGRDDGVVKRALNASGSSYWNWYGRPECFKAEIESGIPTPAPTPTETSKDRKKQVQTALNTAYNCGLVVDGILGDKSKAAIKSHHLRRKDTLMRGAYVKWVQERLLKLGYSLGKHGADSAYGKDTKAAVIAFQRAKGLSADGVVGFNTINALVA